ncbi:glycosyltransferase [Acidocella facilis]|uniref:glycosyltransferase n=1 Tax=Acidocella facilis TaxID=525 RepID=UPI001F17140D|nr:glycosyltransferase [Acidocella facilis]
MAADRHQAVALINRLLEVELNTLELRAENSRLRSEMRPVSGSGGQSFDVPRTVHDWPLSSVADGASSLSLYDIRVDDAVVYEGRRGQAFFDRFFSSDEPGDFSGAVAYLNGIAPQPSSRPDASIVIPVYGQLSYTLNCLESLFQHRSKYSFEIIIVDDVSPDNSQAFLSCLQGIIYQRQPSNGGFINSCNTGASLANGRYMVMLNNDTRVVDGWLDELLGSFNIWPKAGLIGSKLFYSDGSLQEAGGIIWRDGSSWNYGRNDDPNRPQYSHARQVDYISGCSIALPASLWHELGGFDRVFTPAYCEDADLALRVIDRGHEVWFQPRSRIVHYEGKTSGTDTGSGVKAYQVINSKKLFLRWQDRLSFRRRNADAPYFERERDVRKRILVVDITTPTPNQDAGSVQTFMALQCCLELGYKPYFVPVDNWLFQPGYTTDLQRMGVECAYAPYDLDFARYMAHYGWLFDAVLVYRPTVMERCVSVIRETAPQAAVMFHVADLHYLRMERTAALNNDADLWNAAAAMKLREEAMVKAADCTITHSDAEAVLLREMSGHENIVTWPLMFEYFGTNVDFSARKDICFLGGYGHPPNVDAVMYFVEEIFPLIRKANQGIRFLIAGSRVPDEIKALDCEDIEVLGLVDDLRDLFDRARVFVCPLRAGAGVKGKVASSLSYGLPVVSTDIGVEGAGLEEGVHVLVENDPEKFKDAVLRLYNDEALWNHLSKQGQVFVKDRLSTGKGVEVLAKAIEVAHVRRLGFEGHTMSEVKLKQSVQVNG